MLRHANTINFQKGHFDEVISEDFKSKSWNVWVIWYNSAIWVSISDKNRYMKDRERNPQLPFSLHPKHEYKTFITEWFNSYRQNEKIIQLLPSTEAWWNVMNTKLIQWWTFSRFMMESLVSCEVWDATPYQAYTITMLMMPLIMQAMKLTPTSLSK